MQSISSQGLGIVACSVKLRWVIVHAYNLKKRFPMAELYLGEMRAS
jgi:hypothetical protein